MEIAAGENGSTSSAVHIFLLAIEHYPLEHLVTT